MVMDRCMIWGLTTVFVQIHLEERTLGAGIGGEGRATTGPSTVGSVMLGACKTGSGGVSGPSESIKAGVCPVMTRRNGPAMMRGPEKETGEKTPVLINCNKRFNY